MDLPLSRPLVPKLVVLGQCPSTNAELIKRAAAGAEPEFSTLVTTNQTQGRGRLGRIWIAPPGQTLAVSVLVTPALSNGEPLRTEHYGWLSLLAGLAMTRAVAGVLGVEVGATTEKRVTLKWPNDVLIDDRKVAGLLAELLPDGRGVVLGAGLNLSIPANELPTPAATSLTLHGVAFEGLLDAALSGYLRHLRGLYEQLLGEVSDLADPSDLTGTTAATGLSDAGTSIRAQVSAACSTLGKRVRVELPGGDILNGRAVNLDESGRLRINTATDAPLTAVAAGDVTHVR
jgi:BirA family transcriptional regulator, biotin operon repressor / biotin---[acetyl-CoA-carboxylase] ligase